MNDYKKGWFMAPIQSLPPPLSIPLADVELWPKHKLVTYFSNWPQIITEAILPISTNY